MAEIAKDDHAVLIGVERGGQTEIVGFGGMKEDTRCKFAVLVLFETVRGTFQTNRCSLNRCSLYRTFEVARWFFFVQ